MNHELIYILMMTSGVLLWTLGGTLWKGYRRIIFPITIFLFLLLYGLSWWQCLFSSGLLYGCSSLGYGTNSRWWLPHKDINGWHSSKLITAISYNFPALIIGYTWWFIVMPITFLSIFWASNNKSLEKDFVWKVCEGWTGLMVTVTIIGALQHQW